MTTKIAERILLHAPNIHIGGGLQLLKSLLMACPAPFVWAQLDRRIQGECFLPGSTTIHWVNKSVWSRLCAEWRIYRRCAPDDTVLCFHGLPPLLPIRGHVVVFVQNRILFESGSLVGYPFFTRMRLLIERIWVRMMHKHCSRYLVQSPSMATTVRRCLGRNVEISVLPFVPLTDSFMLEDIAPSSRKFDFVYVASGEAHKNHGNLLEAWRLLADEGLKPALALTVNPDAFPVLARKIAGYAQEYGLDIVNLGQLPTMDIPALYQSSSALIFPSQVESFGLPLIEATQLGLPVLASELDYVRDVVQPAETFDPNSPVSIARAVRRFLGNAEPVVQIRAAEEFLAEVLR